LSSVERRKRCRRLAGADVVEFSVQECRKLAGALCKSSFPIVDCLDTWIRTS
jgi:hypothetical protein